MTNSEQTISTFPDYILVERPPDYEVVIDEQPAALMELSVACREAGCNKVLVVGPRTRVSLSPFDIVELGKEIASLDLQMAVVELHDASTDSVSLLESVASNRGSQIQFFDNVADAKNWLQVT